MHLGEQKFQTGDELKRSALNWLSSQDKTFYAARMMEKMCLCKGRTSLKGM
jgi:hypothetical protein